MIRLLELVVIAVFYRGITEQLFDGRPGVAVQAWDRCYDFSNVFAKKWRILHILVPFRREKITVTWVGKKKGQLFPPKIGEKIARNVDLNIAPRRSKYVFFGIFFVTIPSKRIQRHISIVCKLSAFRRQWIGIAYIGNTYMI
jgi:hypothetical protein